MKEALKRLFGRIARIINPNRITSEDYARIQDVNSPPPRLNVKFSDSRNIILTGWIIVGLFFGIGGLWVTFAQISGAVIASGEVKVDTERKTVQHLEGGIIKEIFVRNGDIVAAGQPLVSLDNPRVVASVDQICLQLAALQIENSRLAAEKLLARKVDWPKYDESIPKTKFDELLDAEQKVFVAGRDSLDNQIDLLKKQISQLKQQVLSLENRLKAELQVADALQEELNAKMALYKDQYIDKTKILELKRALAERRGQRAQMQGSQAELRERMAEYGLRIEALRNEYQQRATTQIAEVQQRIFNLQQQLLPLQDALARLTVAAPVGGEVVALQVHSVGGVAAPGQALMDIVPKDNPLIVECHIMVRDITHVHKGQDADVQLLAFQKRNVPKIAGKVTYVSADRIMLRTPYGEQPTYVVHVEIDKEELDANHLYLTAGMPVSVFIRTKPRTVLDYALEPMLLNFERALREN